MDKAVKLLLLGKMKSAYLSGKVADETVFILRR